MPRPCVITEFNKMKCAIVILMFLSAMAQAERDEENILQTVKNFAEGIHNFSIPEKLARNVYTRNLVEATTESIGTVLTNLILEYYQQASRSKDSMIRDIAAMCDQLTEESDDDELMEASLIRINALLQTLLSCIPGNVMIKRRGLPELPKYNGEVVTHLGSEEISTIFLDLARLLDRDFHSIYSLINGMFLAGWEKARFTLNPLQDLFRNDYLNEILRIFGCELARITAHEEYIKNHVKIETWDKYKELKSSVDVALRSLEQ